MKQIFVLCITIFFVAFFAITPELVSGKTSQQKTAYESYIEEHRSNLKGFERACGEYKETKKLLDSVEIGATGKLVLSLFGVSNEKLNSLGRVCAMWPEILAASNSEKQGRIRDASKKYQAIYYKASLPELGHDKLLTSVRMLALEGASYTLLKLKEFNALNKIHDSALALFIDTKQDAYLYFVLSFALFHTSNPDYILNSADAFDEAYPKNPFSPISPKFTSYRVLNVAMQALRGFIDLENGNLYAVDRVRRSLEEEEKRFINQAGLVITRGLGIADVEIAILSAMGGTGYSILGRYDRSKKSYDVGLKRLKSCGNESAVAGKNLFTGLIRYSYVEAVLIPQLSNIDPSQTLTASTDLLESERRNKYVKHVEQGMNKIDSQISLANTCFSFDGKLETIGVRNPVFFGLSIYPDLIKARVSYLKYLHYGKHSSDYSYLDNSLRHFERGLSKVDYRTSKQLISELLYYYSIVLRELPDGIKRFRISDIKKLVKDAGLFEEKSSYNTWKIDYSLGLLSEINRDKKSAIRYAKSSIQKVENSTRKKMLSPILQFSYEEGKVAPYYLLARNSVSGGAAYRGRKNITNLFRAIEGYKYNSIQNFEKKQSSVENNRERISLKDVQNNLVGDELYVSLFYEKNSIYVLYISKHKSFYRVLDRKASRQLLDDLSRLDILRESDDGAEYEKVSRNLYQALFEELKGALDNVSRIIVSPHKRFYDVGWNALDTLKGNKSRFLYEDYIVTIVPSAKPIITRSLKLEPENICGRLFVSHDSFGTKNNSVERDLISNIEKSCWKITKGVSSTRYRVEDIIGEAFSEIILAHGDLSRESVGDFSIRLSKEKSLTLSEIADGIGSPANNSRFVFLANCDSGHNRRGQSYHRNDVSNGEEPEDNIALYNMLLAQGIPYIGISIKRAEINAAKDMIDYIVSHGEKYQHDIPKLFNRAMKHAVRETKVENPLFIFENFILVGA